MVKRPVSMGSMPKSASANSVRPEPSSPVTPTISPAYISKLISRSARPTLSPSTLSRAGWLVSAENVYDFSAIVCPVISKTSRAVSYSLRSPVLTTLPLRMTSMIFRNLQHLVQLVADKEEGDAPGLQLMDHGEQGANLPLGQRAGGLVHDDEPGVLAQRLGDGDELLVGDRHLFHARVERDVDPDLRQRILGDAAHLAPVDHALALGQLLVQGDVFGHREVGEEGKVLVNDLDALTDGVDRMEVLVVLAVDGDRARIARIDAGDDLDQRGFAAAVFADQAVDLARLDAQIDVLQRVHAGKGFVDTGETQKFVGHRPSPRVESGVTVRPVGAHHCLKAAAPRKGAPLLDC